MNTSNRNERKIEILNILNFATSPLSAIEIHDQSQPITLSIETIRSRLLSYVRHGLIERKRVNNNYVYYYVYSITERGIKQLNYFLSIREQVKKQAGILVREPVRFLNE